jgi:hypothetical protein
MMGGSDSGEGGGWWWKWGWWVCEGVVVREGTRDGVRMKQVRKRGVVLW